MRYLCVVRKEYIMKNYENKRNGTSFRGYLLASYYDIVSLYSKPINCINNGKIDAEWVFNTPYGTATIYNYKDGKAYLGDEGIDVTKICEWHIGGKNIETYNWVKRRFYEYKIKSLS